MAQDMLTQLINESLQYKGLDDLEKLVENPSDLRALPLQPLYLALKTSSNDQITEILPKLSKDQRQALLDIDLWSKDEIDLQHFDNWPSIYAHSQSPELISELVKSEQFLLFLKAKFSISTFDEEEPEYPDNDNFFLTEDRLLLIEFSEDCTNINEIQLLLKYLYAEMGVENAYAFLFKLVSDDYSTFQEECYNDKKDRLREYGFVDYYEALELRRSLPSLKALKSHLDKKVVIASQLDDTSKNQTLHSLVVRAYQENVKGISDELAKIKDDSRFHFLHFNFVRLINASLVLNDSLREGSMAITRAGKANLQLLNLGLDWIKNNLGVKETESVFDRFDFFDLFLAGNTLLEIGKKRIKTVLKQSPFENIDNEYFLGGKMNDFLEKSFAEVVMASEQDGKWIDLQNIRDYELWIGHIDLFEKIIPFVKAFWETLERLKSGGSLSDSFYLNYKIAEIDFECLMLSSFINFDLGLFADPNNKKMGVTIVELKSFIKKYFQHDDGNISESSSMEKSINAFLEQFGMGLLGKEGPDYLLELVKIHLEGYDFAQMKDEEFLHVGGPILLR